jgi:phosphopantetheine adenylyltransferase
MDLKKKKGKAKKPLIFKAQLRICKIPTSILFVYAKKPSFAMQQRMNKYLFHFMEELTNITEPTIARFDQVVLCRKRKVESSILLKKLRSNNI